MARMAVMVGVQLRMVAYKARLRSAQSRLRKAEAQMAIVSRKMQLNGAQKKRVVLKQRIAEGERQLAKMRAAAARKLQKASKGAARKSKKAGKAVKVKPLDRLAAQRKGLELFQKEQMKWAKNKAAASREATKRWRALKKSVQQKYVTRVKKAHLLVATKRAMLEEKAAEKEAVKGKVGKAAIRALARKRSVLNRLRESLKKTTVKAKEAALRSKAKALRKVAVDARKWLAVEKKEAKGLQRKLGPVNPYLLFVTKEAKGKPAMKELAAKWKGMSAAQKKPFVEEARWNSAKRSELRAKAKAGRKMTAYQKFFAERMPGACKAAKAKHCGNNRKALVEAAREVAAAWKARQA